MGDVYSYYWNKDGIFFFILTNLYPAFLLNGAPKAAYGTLFSSPFYSHNNPVR